MSNVKIYSPVKGYTGLVGTVAFTNGEGETDADNPQLDTYFRPAGYIVGEADDRAGAIPEYGAKLVVKGAGDGPMIDQVAEAEAEAEAAAKPAGRKPAGK